MFEFFNYVYADFWRWFGFMLNIFLVILFFKVTYTFVLDIVTVMVAPNKAKDDFDDSVGMLKD